MRSAPVSSSSSVYAAVLAGVTAVAMVVMLSWTATPSHFKERLEGAEQKASALAASARSRRGVGLYPTGAVCAGPLVRNAAAARSAIVAAAAANKLALTVVEAGPETPDRLGATLAPIRVRFQAQGGYEGVVGLLDTLARNQPVIFVDNLDLTSRASSVSLAFSGRVYCAG